VITVEMTLDEQRIYARMGISPMVLSTQEVADPRNAVVSVVLPGQAPPQIVSVTPAESWAETAPDNALEAEAMAPDNWYLDLAEPEASVAKALPTRTVRTRSARAKAQDAAVEVLSEVVPAQEPVAAPPGMVAPSLLEAVQEDTQPVVQEPEAEATSTLRRRRRRTSASGDGADD
jgi:ribonuclease E